MAGNGTAVRAPRLKLEALDNKALAIHAGGDNHSDTPKPLGGGGDRIACGVTQPQPKGALRFRRQSFPARACRHAPAEPFFPSAIFSIDRPTQAGANLPSTSRRAVVQ